MGNVREKEKMMLYDYIYNCELLIIDDLGTEVPNTSLIPSYLRSLTCATTDPCYSDFNQSEYAGAF